MAREEYHYPNGDPVQGGICITPIETTSTFVVSIRHMKTANVETVKALLQQRFEVRSITHTHDLVTVEDRRQSIPETQDAWEADFVADLNQQAEENI